MEVTVEETTLLDLPEELFTIIAKHIPVSSLLNYVLTCKLFYDSLAYKDAWEFYYRKRYGKNLELFNDTRTFFIERFCLERMQSSITEFCNDPDLKHPFSTSYKLRFDPYADSSWKKKDNDSQQKSESVEKQLDRMCYIPLKEDSGKASLELRGLRIGMWGEPYGDGAAVDTIINKICDSKLILQNLRMIYIADMEYDECEISWIETGDVTPLLRHFPQLLMLQSKGMNGLDFECLEHEYLLKLVMITGGMPARVVRGVTESTFPSLQHLELYIGTSYYGRDCTVDDFKTLLEEKDVFPSLKYLGLRDADEEILPPLCRAVVKAPIVRRIRVLDMSLGCVGEVEAEILLNGLAQHTNLRKLDLHHHWISEEVQKKFLNLPFKVDLSDFCGGQGDDYRYVEVGE